jgi:hypothetical protein
MQIYKFIFSTDLLSLLTNDIKKLSVDYSLILLGLPVTRRKQSETLPKSFFHVFQFHHIRFENREKSEFIFSRLEDSG